jgi:hypothetical protein
LTVAGNKLLIDYGQLQGLTKGSTFAIYPPGTEDFRASKPLVQAAISELNPTNSALSLLDNPTVDLKSLNSARAVETTHSFGDTQLKVSMTTDAAAKLGTNEVQQIRSLGLVELSSQTQASWDVLLCLNTCPDEKRSSAEKEEISVPAIFTAERSDGSIIARYSVDAVDQLVACLKREAQWRYFKGLENKNSIIEVKMRLVPVANVVMVNNRAVSADVLGEEVVPSPGGQILLVEKSTVMLEFMNTGAEDAYVTVMDLRNDGTIGPLWPHPAIPLGNAEDNKIPDDGKWHRVPFPFVVSIDTLGPEIFKAIATSEPADFSPLLSSGSMRGAPRGRQRGVKESQTKLGSALLVGSLALPSGRARGSIVGVDSSSLALPVADWATTSLSFISIAKQTTLGSQRPLQ